MDGVAQVTVDRSARIPARLTAISMEQVAGAAALILAAGYVATMPLFATVGAPPAGAQARLEYHASGTATWWWIVALSVITDLLFVPLAIALYGVLRRSGGQAMALATAFTLMFVVLDLAVLWPAKVAMIGLGGQYATALPEQREVILAAAGYPAAVIDSALTSVYSILTLGIGLLITNLVLLRSGAARATALVGVATGALGIASVVETMVTGRFPVLVVLASLLTIVWLVMVGWDLLRSRLAVREPRGQGGPSLA